MVGMVHNDAPCGPFHFRQLHRVFDLCVEAYYRQSKMRTARPSTFSRSWQKRETAWGSSFHSHCSMTVSYTHLFL